MERLVAQQLQLMQQQLELLRGGTGVPMASTAPAASTASVPASSEIAKEDGAKAEAPKALFKTVGKGPRPR